MRNDIKVEYIAATTGRYSRVGDSSPVLSPEVDAFAVERAWKSLMKNHTLGQPISRRLVAEALKAALGKQKS